MRVNTQSNIYHLPGSRYDDRTGPNWRSMTLAEARTAGARPARRRGAAAATSRSGVYSVRRTTGEEAGVVIRSWIGPPQTRARFENEMMSASEYAIDEIVDWERAHSQGAGLGVEAREAIRLAPPLVNQVLQNRGIERFLREMRDLAQGERIHLTTVTETHTGTLRLASIHYSVEAVDADGRRTLFDAAIEVRRNGESRAGVRLPGSDSFTWGPWLSE